LTSLRLLRRLLGLLLLRLLLLRLLLLRLLLLRRLLSAERRERQEQQACPPRAEARDRNGVWLS
jgi:hypothetical protein